MMRSLARALPLCLLTALPLLHGCQSSSSSDKVVQFQATPRATLSSGQQLAPLDNRSVTDILRDADREFQAANDAQLKGNSEASLQHYTKMLQLLQAANLDPSIFYSVREEFGQIVDESAKRGNVYLQQQPQSVTQASNLGALQIPLPLPEQVIQEIEEIQRVYPRSFQIGLDRSHRYLPFIKAEFRKAGLPEELAYLAMVESQYNPKIDSPAGAGGMWQFMRATGGRFNLRIDNYVDERYNWQSATRAAASYLQTLNEHFDGNWPLAVSSYNMGEYGLERACAANGGERDFWKLIQTPPASDRIKTETKKFYPRFLATCIVASNPERYGFKSNPQAPLDIVRIPVRGVYALADLDRAMNLPAGTLAKLNPDLINEITPPTGDYFIAVEPAHQQTLLAALSNVPQVSPNAIPTKRQPQKQQSEVVVASHKVNRGETITSIARKYKISNDELLRANNMSSSRSLRSGQKLKIPSQPGKDQKPGQEPLVLASVDTKSARPGAPKASSYTVKRGDTLSTIAAKHRVSVPELQEWNKLSNRSRIHVGTKLVIHPNLSAPAEVDSQEATIQVAERVHEVQRGEYASKIAEEYGIATKDLLAWNNKTADATLKVGEKLVIRGGKDGANHEEIMAAVGVTDVDTTVRERTHEVKSGEFPSKIAQQYGISTGELLAANKLAKNATLHVGDKLVIRGGRDGNFQEIAAGGKEEPVLTAAAPERVHEVQAGEFPSKIASIYGVPLDDLLAWNQLGKDATIRIGDKLILRGGQAAAKQEPVKTAKAAEPAPEPAKAETSATYTVQSGDSPVKIAKAHKISVDDLLAANSLTRDSVLKIGQKMKVPGTKETVAAAPVEEAPVKTASAATPRGAHKSHTVARGETASAIAAKYKVKVADLLAWNKLSGNAVLKVGQELVVYAQAETKQEAPTKTASAKAPGRQQDSGIKHVVMAGHNPSTIARRYGVGIQELYQWNGWNQSHILRIGEEVLILKP